MCATCWTPASRQPMWLSWTRWGAEGVGKGTERGGGGGTRTGRERLPLCACPCWLTNGVGKPYVMDGRRFFHPQGSARRDQLNIICNGLHLFFMYHAVCAQACMRACVCVCARKCRVCACMRACAHMCVSKHPAWSLHSVFCSAPSQV